MLRRIRPCSRGCRSVWSRRTCSAARRSPWMRRPWRRTRRCEASCGGRPGRAISSSSRGSPRPPASRRRAGRLAAVQASAPTALVGDRGYHSNDTLLTLRTLGIRAYLVEPERGRRCWRETPEAQGPVYGNRRRVGGARGRRLMRRRGEYVERTFAHVYDTGGLRRVLLRGHPKILKRLTVHAGPFHLRLLIRPTIARGTPRGV